MAFNTNEAESSARDLLQHLGLVAPPVQPPQIIIDLGYEQLPLWNLKNSDMSDDELKVMSKLIGAAAISEKTVYVIDELPWQKHQWLLLHEAGHIWMPWHGELSYLDTEFELSQSVRDTMEVEANAFAAEIRFFGDDFRLRMSDYSCDWKGITSLAKVYGASIESTLAHYVLNSSRPIWLQVFKPIETLDGSPTLKAQYFRKPKCVHVPFQNSLRIGDSLQSDHELVKSINNGELGVGKELLETFDLPNVGAIKTRIFWTGYKAFMVSTI